MALVVAWGFMGFKQPLKRAEYRTEIACSPTSKWRSTGLTSRHRRFAWGNSRHWREVGVLGLSLRWDPGADPLSGGLGKL